ncbi:MAG: hypothetical protein IPL86_15430 [Flavobacteriales bacterium]|nr:hypothetical protein [Flavobacteriales bacterium]
MKTIFTLVLVACITSVHAQNAIYSYAIGNWRNGPTVMISPLFETTEQFTTPQLIAQVKKIGRRHSPTPRTSISSDLQRRKKVS